VTRVGGGAAAIALVLALGASAGACGGGEDPSFGPDDSAPASASADGSTSSTTAGAPTSTTTPTVAEADVEVSSELPEGWPDDLPIPDDAILELGQRTEAEDGSVLLTADFTVEDGGANVYTAFLDGLEGDGTTILQRSSGGTENGFVGSISFSRDNYDGNVAVDEATGRTILSVSVVLPD